MDENNHPFIKEVDYSLPNFVKLLTRQGWEAYRTVPTYWQERLVKPVSKSETSDKKRTKK